MTRPVAEEEDIETLGRLLLAEGMVTQEQLDQALSDETYAGSRIVEVLRAVGHVRTDDLTAFLGMDYHVPRLESLPDDEVNLAVAGLLPAALLRRSKLLPFAKLGDIIVIAFAELPEEKLVADIRRRLGVPVKIVLTAEADIERHLARLAEPPSAPRSKTDVVASTATETRMVAAVAGGGDGIEAEAISPDAFAALVREYSDPTVQRWERLFASGEPLAAIRVGRGGPGGNA